MKRILLFGDTHIPTRRDSIPSRFYEHIETAQYDFALCTGDLVREQEMRSALPPLPKCYIVMGNMDWGSKYHHHEQIKTEDIDILLIHGTHFRPRGNLQQLWEIVIQVGADIGIHGHTHKPSINLYKERLLLNPGTISGATGGWRGRTNASFMELEISGKEIRVILHNTNWKIIKTSEIDFKKQDDQIMKA